jgi:hypothetical protein
MNQQQAEMDQQQLDVNQQPWKSGVFLIGTIC